MGLLGGNIGFVNIYAHNDSFLRCRLWETLMIELPGIYRWVLVGDFNIVETRLDKINQCGRMIPMVERILTTRIWCPI